jgi:hypothetical protein
MQEEQAKHAFFLSLAALLGEKVFNFGELLAHKVTSTALLQRADILVEHIL